MNRPKDIHEVPARPHDPRDIALRVKLLWVLPLRLIQQLFQDLDLTRVAYAIPESQIEHTVHLGEMNKKVKKQGIMSDHV